jgi:hypothetical protein
LPSAACVACAIRKGEQRTSSRRGIKRGGKRRERHTARRSDASNGFPSYHRWPRANRIRKALAPFDLTSHQISEVGRDQSGEDEAHTSKRHHGNVSSGRTELRKYPSELLPPVGDARAMKRLSVGLKRGECAVVGWQCAAPTEPKWLTALLARNVAKSKRRARYERQFKRGKRT